MCGIAWFVGDRKHYQTTVVESYEWCTASAVVKGGWTTMKGGMAMLWVQGRVGESEERQGKENEGRLECDGKRIWN